MLIKYYPISAIISNIWGETKYDDIPILCNLKKNITIESLNKKITENN